jgi:GNAT superfamily N-acetyltransferase
MEEMPESLIRQPPATPPASGTAIKIRPIETRHKAALASAVELSSDDAVYRRFLNPHGRLTASELRYLTEVDHRDHEALLAVDPGSSKSVGVARYVRDRHRRDRAEIAVAVLEPWQGRGVGKALLRRLADRARDEGVTQSQRSCCPTTGPCDGCSPTLLWRPRARRSEAQRTAGCAAT